MKLSLGEIATTLGSSTGEPDRVAESYSIDSRTLAPGALFLAIRGARLDGHQFVAQAFERGAVAGVVEEAFRANAAPELQARLIPVGDTTRALQELGRAVRRRWGQKVIAVTGSTGKTTTKELIAAVLARRGTVHKSPGNLNNEFGVPLTLLALDTACDVAVVEMGMSAPGEITQLARIAEPEIGVVTNVAPVHLEYFESLDAIGAAKRELIENLQPPAVAVLNYDDPRVRRFGEGFDGRVVTYGFSPAADFRAVGVTSLADRTGQPVETRFRVEGPALAGSFDLPLPGKHNVENALAAIATASLFRLDAQEVFQALDRFRPPHQRTEILAVPSGAIVIDDSYNSNPRAMEQMLATLREWPPARRRIVVAGEMLELGPSSPEWHRAIGRRCAETKIDWLIAVEGDARYFLEGAREAGLDGGHTRFFAAAHEAGAFCQTLVEPGDVVLVKGSRGVRLEEVVRMLRLPAPAEPASCNETRRNDGLPGQPEKGPAG